MPAGFAPNSAHSNKYPSDRIQIREIESDNLGLASGLQIEPHLNVIFPKNSVASIVGFLYCFHRLCFANGHQPWLHSKCTYQQFIKQV